MACGPAAFKAESPSAWLEKPQQKQPDLSDSSLNTDPGDLISLDNEKEDDYEDPFSDVNQKVDLNNPAVTMDLTPQRSIRDQVVGSPQKGSLESPTNLFNLQLRKGSNSPFKIISPSRQAFFGSAELVSFVDFLAQSMRLMIPDSTLLIGNMSTSKGGRLGTHLSHQNGMDVDIGYIHPPQVKVAQFIDVVSPKDIGKNLLLKEQLYLFNLAVHSNEESRVDRIFVHPTIKKALCATARSMGALDAGNENVYAVETLRRLIPDVNHANHFHLRVKCTKENPRCIQMAEPAKGHGC